MGQQKMKKKPPKKKKPLPIIKRKITIVPKKLRRPKIKLKARMVAREGGAAAEASISYGPFGLAGGALSFSAMDRTSAYGRLFVGLGAKGKYLSFRYKGGLSYGALGTSNIITAHHFGTSFRLPLGPARIRLAAAVTPLASYEPVFIESQWGAGASISFLDKFTPYVMAGGRLSSGTPVHARTHEYLIPRYENLILGAQYNFKKTRFGKGKLRAEAELSPFYKGGIAALTWKGKRWKISFGAGVRKWHEDLFAGKTEPIFKGLFSYNFDFGKRVAAKGEVDVEQTTFETYTGSPIQGEDYEKTSLTEIVGKKVPGEHDSSTFPVFLYTDPESAPADLKDDIVNTRDAMFKYFGTGFLSAVSSGYMDDLVNASISLSTKEKVIRASFLAEMMKILTYDPEYDAIGRPREVYGKGPEQFLTDMQEVIHRTASGREVSGWLNPKTSCNEIHHTATTYLRKSGVKAFTISTATPGWNWHVISAAVGDDGLYLIDFGDLYRSKKYDLGLLLQSYAKEKGRVILGSYIYTDTDYLGLYTTPEGKLMKGVMGVDHYSEIANMLGVER